MAYKPLMLSDTAMVLLREYLEVFETEVLRLTYVKKISLRAGQKCAFMTSPRLRVLAEEFMRDLEVLWLCLDLVPIRHLNQHFVLNDDLQTLLAQALTELSHPHASRMRTNLRAAAFVAHVAQAYQAARIIPHNHVSKVIDHDLQAPDAL